ncbi:integrase [Gossypium australe]|uniref:Integrase n=1 Tax=Gossypium australe TaxID=47621 RepID=A0A5B6VBF6_9ROSI|nr:integrase [Gossypium australe]
MNAHLTIECDGSILAKLIAKIVFLYRIQSCRKMILSCKRNGNWLTINRPLSSVLVTMVAYTFEIAHNCVYTIHLGSNKIYKNLKPLYWWPGMEREISEYVARYLPIMILE